MSAPIIDVIVPVKSRKTSDKDAVVWRIDAQTLKRLDEIGSACHTSQIEGVTSEFYVCEWNDLSKGLKADVIVDSDGAARVRVDSYCGGETPWEVFDSTSSIRINKLREAARAGFDNGLSTIVHVVNDDTILAGFKESPGEMASEIPWMLGDAVAAMEMATPGEDLSETIHDELQHLGFSDPIIVVA